MFKDCALLAMHSDEKKMIKVYRISEDAGTQAIINKSFSEGKEILTNGKRFYEFDGKYTPDKEDNEYLYIKNFSLQEDIKNAIKNPMGLELYAPINGELPEITAIFVGRYDSFNGKDSFTIAFQKFKKDQYITQSRHHLFFSKDTFRKNSDLGISVSNCVDCVVHDDNLIFSSFFYARQIFDLSGYYREATNPEVKSFVTSAIISMDNHEEFVVNANSWERKTMASINDSGLILKHTAEEIKKVAKKDGVAITIRNNKIILPPDTKERRVILGFLDEGVFKGVFSNTVFQTNSKRKAT